MHRITISNGISAIGGHTGIGKSIVALKLANFLAQKERVLYYSTHHYKELLEHLILQIDKHIEKKLHLETNLENIYSFDFVKLFQFIEDNGFKIIIFDDLSIIEYHLGEKIKQFIEFLSFISEKLKLKIIIVINLHDSLFNDDNEQIQYAHQPIRISMFNYIYNIQFSNICNEIYGLFRPSYFNMSSDDNLSIYSLKNSECAYSVFDNIIDFPIRTT